MWAKKVTHLSAGACALSALPLAALLVLKSLAFLFRSLQPRNVAMSPLYEVIVGQKKLHEFPLSDLSAWHSLLVLDALAQAAQWERMNTEDKQPCYIDEADGGLMQPLLADE